MVDQKIVTLMLITLFTASGTYTLLDITSQETSQKLNKTVKVIEVIDGDTIKVKTNTETDTVRILGIDTPETTGQNKPDEFFLKDTQQKRKCLNKVGEKASDYVKKTLTNKTVQLTQDPQSDKRGHYGRLLAYIKYNETTLGEKMLEKGYARVYNSTFTKRSEYREIETQSRENEIGIWNTSCGK